jgi:AcrR family transcriptional regulator
MDNSSRSERTRVAVIQSALAIIVRDGPHRLTLDAIARESGISKGGVMHQFPTKEAVLKALLAHQTDHFNDVSQRYLEEHGASHTQPLLAARIATSRDAIADTHSVAFAILAAAAQSPGLLSIERDDDEQSLREIRAEAADPDLALLRCFAARGMVLSTLLGLNTFSDEERDRLFDRLLDESRWTGCAQT